MTIRAHLRAAGALPAMATLVVPAAIVIPTRGLLGWGLPPATAWLPVVLGCGLAGIGLALGIRTVILFARAGEGTLAPWDPPRHFVVTGPYRYVRNPMISGVLFIILGEAVALGSLPLLAWFAVFFGINATYIPLLEEPGLVRRFDEEYREYRRHVPRWVPRVTAWEPPLPP